MALTITIAASHTFPAGVPVTLAALRKAAVPGIVISGSVAAGDLAAGAVTPAKVTPGAYFYAPATLTGGVYVLTLDPALTAYAAGNVFAFKADAANAGAVDVNVNGLGARDLKRPGGAELGLADIKANQVVECRDNGTYLEVTSLLATREVEYIATDSGTANAYAAAPSPSYASWAAATGKVVAVKIANANTTASTLNLNGLGTQAIKKHGTQALESGDLGVGLIAYFMFDGTNMQLLNPSVRAAARAWCKFGGVATSKTITNTVDTGTERLTVSAHGLTAATSLDNVQLVTVRNSGGALPAGLTVNTAYYAFIVDANTVSLHTSRQGGLDGVSDIVNLTGNGTGTNSLDIVTMTAGYNVAGVMATAAAGSVVGGDYTVVFVTAFTNGEFVLVGSAKSGVGNGLMLAIDESDPGLAGSKRIQVTNDLGTDVNSAECHVVAFGNQ